ncbi:MAG: hypothetical protein JXQ23_05250 [Clostridia bacterium]|nr:hypothetical protein [Clostridia bacterium]
MNLLKKYLIRKFIPFIAIIGSLTPFAISIQHIINQQINVITQSLIFVIFILAGIIIGSLASAVYTRNGKDILTYNYLDKALLIKQKAYFLFPLATVAGYMMGISYSGLYAIACAILYSMAFVSGIGIGIFDYRDVLNKNTLYVGTVPIGLSFIYAYYATQNPVFVDVVWVYGSVYLYAYLLFINRMRLDSIIFFRNSVNVENSKSIRVFNDILITGFFSLFLIFFNFRKVISFGYSFVMKGIEWLFAMLATIMNSLLSFAEIPPSEGATEDFNQFLGGEAIQTSLFLKILIFTFGALFCLAILIVIFIGIRIVIRAIRKFMGNLSGVGNNSAKEKKIKTKEYEEESEIIKSSKKKEVYHHENKYLYTLKGLDKLQNDDEKLRYLYGFALERLIIQDVRILKSDTPVQILDKIAQRKGGIELNEEQFSKFTEEYRRVRYGYKPSMKIDFTEKGKELEKRIAEIKINKQNF